MDALLLHSGHIAETLGLALLLGLVSGFKHAFEPDHVIALSTLMHRESRWRRIAWMGSLWGLGHTTTLVAGVLLIRVFQMQVSEATLGYFEVPVAAMLVGLGVWAVWEGVRHARSVHSHTHDAVSHAHVGDHPHPHGFAEWRSGWSSFGVGLVHGLAGSGAMLLLVGAALPTLTQGLLYSLVYGGGSILGMVGVAIGLAVPFRAAQSRPLFYAGLTGVSGVLSVALGALIVWEMSGGIA